MVVTKNVQDSQIDSTWQSLFPERLPCGRLPVTERRTTGRRAATDARLASR